MEVVFMELITQEMCLEIACKASGFRGTQFEYH
jgi:hypothetical protein